MISPSNKSESRLSKQLWEHDPSLPCYLSDNTSNYDHQDPQRRDSTKYGEANLGWDIEAIEVLYQLHSSTLLNHGSFRRPTTTTTTSIIRMANPSIRSSSRSFILRHYLPNCQPRISIFCLPPSPSQCRLKVWSCSLSSHQPTNTNSVPPPQHRHNPPPRPQTPRSLLPPPPQLPRTLRPRSPNRLPNRRIPPEPRLRSPHQHRRSWPRRRPPQRRRARRPPPRRYGRSPRRGEDRVKLRQ